MTVSQINNGDIREKLFDFFNVINKLTDKNIKITDSVTAELVDKEFLEEIRQTALHEDSNIFFGSSLKELKCIVRDTETSRNHEVIFCYKGPQKLKITSLNLPYSILLEQEFKSINELISAIQEHLQSLGSYLNELEHLDQCCCIMEPINPTFKDDFRRIYLDDRTWLHIEVTPQGLATNIHLVGQSSCWHDQLNKGLLTWDHDMGIVDNIMTVFGFASFPMPETKQKLFEHESSPESITCGICLCTELPDNPGIPQPICQNKMCGVHYHRGCLFEWLIACSGGRPPAFGVATGSCPTCLQPISCSDKDN